jgi:hypothetical protein
VTRTLLLLTFVAFILVPATNAAAPVVPVRTQAQIAKARPALAYAPTRMVIGFRFRSWRTGLATVYERFTNKAGWEITFVSAPLRGLCRAGSSKTFQLDGNKVYWSKTVNEQQAWRCVRNRGGLWVRLVAASPQPPTKLADSGLGRVVASAKRI